MATPEQTWRTSRLSARPATAADAQIMFDSYLMSEAVKAVVSWAFAQPDIYRVWATCDVENVASARLLERVGMQREGVLRRWLIHPNMGDTPRDCFCYAIVKAG